MYFEEYGKDHEQTIVFLHGANFVYTFGKQYDLASKYHIYVPHIKGYGRAASELFTTEDCVNELADFIEDINKGLQKKVVLIGFSLGAQLAYMMVSLRPDLFSAAIIVSPWLIKEEPFLSKVMDMNLRQLQMFKKKKLSGFVGMMNGLPKEARAEFVEQMQLVSEETVRNVVDNKITLESMPDFKNADIPILALAGAREQKEIKDSVLRMEELNPNCKAEIWPKAGHNIPQMFAKQFNETIEKYV